MKTYKNYYIVTDIPEIVYRALVNPLILKLWTGFDATMSEEVGAEFALWEGNIAGVNLAFEKNKMIQQQWFFGDQEEPSIVTIKLHEHKKGTSVELVHTNIPDQDYEAMVEGWDDTYFADLVDFFMGE